MRISDWSSDVCSSDLGLQHMDGAEEIDRRILVLHHPQRGVGVGYGDRGRRRLGRLGDRGDIAARGHRALREIGRASCLERVCQYVSTSAVAVSLKNTIIHTVHRLTAL